MARAPAPQMRPANPADSVGHGKPGIMMRASEKDWAVAARAAAAQRCSGAAAPAPLPQPRALPAGSAPSRRLQLRLRDGAGRGALAPLIMVSFGW
jgi:hypothetical protein